MGIAAPSVRHAEGDQRGSDAQGFSTLVYGDANGTPHPPPPPKVAGEEGVGWWLGVLTQGRSLRRPTLGYFLWTLSGSNGWHSH